MLGGSSIEKTITRPLEEPGFAPNLIVTRSPVPEGVDPDLVLADSARQLKDTIPGLILIEDAPWPGENRTWRGMLRTGAYILDDQALTISQWAWISVTSDGGHALWTASFTCRTSDLWDCQEEAADMIATLEVYA